MPLRPAALCLASVLGLALAGVAVAQPDAPGKVSPDTVRTKDGSAATSAKPEVEEKVLGIGDAAPPISVEHYIKGEPVSGFEPGKVYVVEFWATWCGPCIAAFPHLSELQTQYKDKGVRVVGVNFAEREYNDETRAKIAEFVEKQGDKMAYTVAYDGPSAKMGQSYMRASRQSGIPCAFIINQAGMIAWIGHPGAMDEVLSKVVAGAWDMEAAKNEAKAEQDRIKAQREAQRERQRKLAPIQKKIREAVAASEWDTAIAGLDELQAASPEMAGRLEVSKFLLLLQQADQPDRAYAMKDALLANKDVNSNPQALNQIAWTVLDSKEVSKRDYDFAMTFAMKADEAAGGKDGMITDTLARAYWEKGNKAKAAELQAKAVRQAEEEKAEPDQIAELKATLKKYQDGAAATAPSGQK